MCTDLTELINEINRMGANDRERAQRLGVSVRTITEYKAGRFPRIIFALAENPNLITALHAAARKFGTCSSET